jgi:hypothetical protein
MSHRVPDDLLEVHLAANFLFEIQLLLRELGFQFGDFAVGKRVAQLFWEKP